MFVIGFRVKSTDYFWSYGPFSALKNGFRSITFEKISELDSYFIHKHKEGEFNKFVEHGV